MARGKSHIQSFKEQREKRQETGVDDEDEIVVPNWMKKTRRAGRKIQAIRAREAAEEAKRKAEEARAHAEEARLLAEQAGKIALEKEMMVLYL